MVNREVRWDYLLIAFLTTAIIFGAIFASGMLLSDYKVNALQENIENVEVEHNSRIIGQQLSVELEEDSCNAMGSWMNSTVDDLRILRKEVASYENANKIDNENYEIVKEKYMNLLLQNMAQVRKYDRNCDREVVDIVYFYSDDCDACKDQGTVLTQIRQDYGRKVVVYPLDTELGMQPIDFLLEYYEIDRYPSLVIDGETVEGFQSMEELENAIDENLNSTEKEELNSTEEGER